MTTTYAEAGVDIDLGDAASRILYEAARKTWQNRKGLLGEVLVPFDDFSGLRAIDVSGLPAGTLMNVNFDGVGTKVELAERAEDHRTLAYDLLAMVCDDAVVRGGEPVLAGSILDVNTLGNGKENHLEQVRQLAKGYVEAARAANVAIVNGEMAELGSRVGGYGPFNCNWGAAVVWFANKSRMLTGHAVKPGDSIVGLRESGFRSNGLSLVRRIFSKAYGSEWHREKHEGKSLAAWALQPSKIYSRAVVEMFGGLQEEPAAELHAVAHITGGGVPSKLGRGLKPSKLGAELEELFEPSPFVKYCQQTGEVSDAEAYRTWNMGQGMLIATPEPEAVQATAKKYGIESKVVGTVTAKPGIRLRSKGIASPGEVLEF